jgi:hypothetical protein
MRGRGQPALMRKSTPIRVVIPAIGADSVLMRLGLKRDGKLQWPAERLPGWRLHPAGSAEAGDKVAVPRRDSSAAVFQVSLVKLFPKMTFPSAAVYGDIDHAGPRLITCGGYDISTAKYEDNVVVFADLTI